jgi:hypothetical protein
MPTYIRRIDIDITSNSIESDRNSAGVHPYCAVRDVSPVSMISWKNVTAKGWARPKMARLKPIGRYAGTSTHSRV